MGAFVLQRGLDLLGRPAAVKSAYPRGSLSGVSCFAADSFLAAGSFFPFEAPIDSISICESLARKPVWRL